MPALILSRTEVFGSKSLLLGDHSSQNANGPTNHDPRNGTTPTCGASLMDSRHPKAMLQLIVGARQAVDVIAVKQATSEVSSEVPKMLQGLAEGLESCLLLLHLRHEGQVALAHLCPSVLLWISQDLCRLVDQSVGLLERRPQGCRGLQAFCEELLQLL